MSLTQSRGLTDAGRWTAVATTLVEHLDALENADRHGATVPPLHSGAIEAARRFFAFVLSGIALDQKRGSVGSVPSPARPSQAMAAGISNLSIAVKVMRSEKPNASTDNLDQVEREIKSLLVALNHLQEGKEPLSIAERKSLAMFLRELQRQGEIERDAKVAAQERPPRAYHGLTL
jgi:hypothetical protein